VSFDKTRVHNNACAAVGRMVAMHGISTQLQYLRWVVYWPKASGGSPGNCSEPSAKVSIPVWLTSAWALWTS